MKFLLTAVLLVSLAGCAVATEAPSTTGQPQPQASEASPLETGSSPDPEESSEPVETESASEQSAEPSAEPSTAAKPSTAKPAPSRTPNSNTTAEPTPEPTASTTQQPKPQPTATTAPGSITKAEVAKNNSRSSCWVIVDGSVHNLTKWINEHPGGASAILALCGRDASDAFAGQHGGQARPSSVLDGYFIGPLAD